MITTNFDPIERELLKKLVSAYGKDSIVEFVNLYSKWLEHNEFCRCKCWHECSDNPKNYRVEGDPQVYPCVHTAVQRTMELEDQMRQEERHIKFPTDFQEALEPETH